MGWNADNRGERIKIVMAMETPKISNSTPATGATPKPATPVASNAAKVTSKTSALDAASGTTSMEAELRAEESGPPKIDNKKLTAGIGSATSGADDQLVAEAKKESARKVEDAGKSPAGDALSTAGGIVAAVGGVLAVVLGPFGWIGLIVAAVGGILGLVGSGLKSGAKTSQATVKASEETRLEHIEGSFDKSKRPNIIVANLQGEEADAAKPEDASSAAASTLEESDVTSSQT